MRTKMRTKRITGWLFVPVLEAPVLAMPLAGCAEPMPPNSVAPSAYAGYYRQGFEQSDFYPTSGGGPYWLTAEGDVWSRLQDYYNPAPGRGGGITVRLVVEGRLETGTGFGHLGAYPGALTVDRILDIEAMDPDEIDARIAEIRNRGEH